MNASVSARINGAADLRIGADETVSYVPLASNRGGRSLPLPGMIAGREGAAPPKPFSMISFSQRSGRAEPFPPEIKTWEIDLRRLTLWSRSDGNQNRSWSLSTIGDWDSVTENGTTENRTHTAAHEIETIDGNAVTHDAKGNLTSTPDGRSFVWDFDNRLASATVGANSDGIEGTHSYTYDALGRRVTKTVNDAQANNGAGQTTTTLYVCAGQQVLCEYSVPTTGPPAANAPDQRFVYGEYVDEPILKDGLTNGTTGVVYYSRNQQYSITSLTNAAGSVIERYAYTAYGQTKIFRGSGVPLAASARQNEYTYTGRRADRETGLMYFRARMYDAQLGRFASRDPLGFVDGLSLYRGYFVPNKTDPMGRQVQVPLGPPKGKCRVSLDCVNIVGNVGTHCGIVMTHTDEMGGLVVKRLHSWGWFHPGGKSCKISNGRPPSADDESYYQHRIGEYDKSICDCISNKVAAFNTFIDKYTYKVFPGNNCSRRATCNSNYSAHCLLRGCGLRISWNWPPEGWNHRLKKCTDRRCNSRGCRCKKWETVDTSICGQ